MQTCVTVKLPRMEQLDLSQLGARQIGPSTLQFGMLLPWVTPANDQQLSVKVIHEHDQFLQHVPTVSVPMTHTADTRYGDKWTATVDLSNVPNTVAGSSWGKPGRYVYRYSLTRNDGPEIDWITDPYAREFGVGKQSAITLDYSPYVWSSSESTWKTPLVEDLVMYELNLAEFANDLGGAIERLNYLSDLGINCIQLMPISNVASEIDWGYLPIGYFGVDERFGKRSDLQHFIDEAHRHGIAVLVDAVYGHSSRRHFAYSYVYSQLGYSENPFMGPFAEDLFSNEGASTDYNRTITQDFFYTVNMHWLEVFHIDGFRYDCVPNYWDGPMGSGYANLAFNTFEAVNAKLNDSNSSYWSRFASQGRCNLIQCAEYLNDPPMILNQSFSTTAWQNQTISAAEQVAHGEQGALYRLGASLSLMGYPTEISTNGVTLTKTALQYIENHDHSRFVANFGSIQTDEAGENLFLEGDRNLWYKVQPYLIGILTAKGTPMLWQGQEVGESYTVPWRGAGRVAMLRPVRWDEFYDEPGRSTIALVRKLLHLRLERHELRRGDHYFHNNHDLYQSRGVLLFTRQLDDAYTLIALNFTDETQLVPFNFPKPGTYTEKLHGYTWDVQEGESMVEVPSNYGRIWSI